MKILVFAAVLGVENNGQTVATMNLIRYLKKKGHEVRLLLADFGIIAPIVYFIHKVCNKFL